MLASIDDIKEKLTAAASTCVSGPEAAYFAELGIDTHLRKAPRMNPLQEAIDDIKKWRSLEGSRVQTIEGRGSVLLLDFDGLPPSLKIKYIHDELEKRARQHGLAAAGFRNSNGVITLCPWSTGLAKRGLIGISMFNGGTACCVPYGARSGVLGTNPLAYAIPTETDPIILDMATTEIPFFEVKTAKADGLALPPHSAVGPDGSPTTDAAQALTDRGIANLLPMGGGFKGYGILMLIEILTGPLVRSLLSTRQSAGWHPREYGCLVIAIDVAGFTDPTDFRRSVSAMCDQIRHLPPAEGFAAVRMPGDRGNAKVNRGLASRNIEIDEKLMQQLMKL
jgi:ureidoglycolate dehydrogenase (NAD+)